MKVTASWFLLVSEMCGGKAMFVLRRCELLEFSDILNHGQSNQMQAIVGLVSLALAVYGFTHAGVLGMLTGVIAGFGVGSGLSILAALKFTDVSITPSERAAQRLGGLVSAVACAAGVYYGGWTLGSVLGLVGYAAGMLTTLLLGAIASKRGSKRPTAVSAQRPV
jgi:hypothetical protein